MFFGCVVMKWVKCFQGTKYFLREFICYLGILNVKGLEVSEKKNSTPSLCEK